MVVGICLVGCNHTVPQAVTQPAPALNPVRVLGAYDLKLPGQSSKDTSYVEALLLTKDGKFNIVFPSLLHGYYTVGTWKVEGPQIHLFPATVDQKDHSKIESDLSSGTIPSTERSRLELLFKDRLLTPIFDKDNEHPRLRVESPEVEQAVEPKLGGGPIFLAQ